LALRPLKAIRQRVTLAYQVPPLTAAETAQYLVHQLQHVGVDRPVFAETATQAAFTWSQGIPRRINHWARAALMAASAAQRPIVDEATVTVAEAELQWAGAL
jgi:type II secretory pathway predicted ATPase ExeA